MQLSQLSAGRRQYGQEPAMTVAGSGTRRRNGLNSPVSRR
jgi:hypothetical protein